MSSAQLRASGQACADAAERLATDGARTVQQAARTGAFHGVDISAFARLDAHREVRGGAGGDEAEDPAGCQEPSGSGRASASGGSSVDVTAYSRLRSRR